MRCKKQIAWVAGMTMLGVAVANAPAVAIPNYSDTSGTHTTGQTDVLFGFQALNNEPGVNSALKDAFDATNQFLGNGQGQTTGVFDATNQFLGNGQGQTTGVFDATNQFLGNGQGQTTGAFVQPSQNTASTSGGDAEDGLSPQTRSALLDLAKYLQEIDNGLWAYGNDLDKAVQDSATGLLADLKAAHKGCQAEVSRCKNFKSLFTKASNFAQKLKAFETLLHERVQKARIY